MRSALFLACAALAAQPPEASRHIASDAARHIFTGTVSRIIDVGDPEACGQFACVLVDRVERSHRRWLRQRPRVGDEATVEFLSAAGGGSELRAGQLVRCHADSDFRLCGLEILEEPTERQMSLEREEAADVGPILPLETRLEWPFVLDALRVNWASSSFLRRAAPPSPPWAGPLSNGGPLWRSACGSMIVVLTRRLPVSECSWLARDLQEGERFSVYTGHTYGAVSPAGIAVQPLAGDDGSGTDPDSEAPFIELPRSALRAATREEAEEAMSR